MKYLKMYCHSKTSPPHTCQVHNNNIKNAVDNAAEGIAALVQTPVISALGWGCSLSLPSPLDDGTLSFLPPLDTGTM